jgi:transforming growth factor-beta-induced protein
MCAKLAQTGSFHTEGLIMKMNLFAGLWCGLIAVLAGCSAAPDSEQSNRRSGDTGTSSDLSGDTGVVETLESREEFKMLSTVLTAAGVKEALKGNQGVTIFAPSNEAFTNLGAQALADLLADPQQLGELLLSHVAPAPLTAAEARLAGGAVTLSGAPVTFAERDGGLFVNDSRIVKADIRTRNGIIHVIDQVLTVPRAEAAKDIVAIASADSRFSTLVTALKAADLVEALQGEGPFTVFAPTNDAFAALGAATVSSLLADKSRLQDILLYHVVKGEAVDAKTASGLSEATMANGDEVRISYKKSELQINDARVVIKDIKAKNGIIHVIDAVLVPAAAEEPQPESPALPPAPTPEPTLEDIVTIASGDPRFSTLVKAVAAADLVSTLQGAGPFTVFAPTDDAFAKLGVSLEALVADKAALTDILAYHVVSGAAVDAQAASKLTEAKMLNGETVRISVKDGALRINEATVIIKDIKAKNGIIHVIDAVLLPPKDLVDVISADSQLKTLKTALEASGLVQTLKGPGPFTVFAPTDAAFQKLGAHAIQALLADKHALHNVLLYHVIKDAAVPASEAVKLPGATMANGQAAHFSHVYGHLLINGVRVVVTDIKAQNGIVHLIDAVLLP